MAKSGWVFCSRITTVGLPTANAVVKSKVAMAEPPQPMTSSATHCAAPRPRKNLHPSTTAGTEYRSRDQVLEEHYLGRRRHLQQGHPQDGVRPPHRRPDGDEQDANVTAVPPAHELLSPRPAELRDDALAVGLMNSSWLRPDVVDVDLVEAEIHVVLDVI